MGMVIRSWRFPIFFFIDNTSIFCQSEERTILNLQCICLYFRVISGLNINLSKLEIVKIGDRRDESKLTRVLDCKLVTLAIKYLGYSWAPSIRMRGRGNQ